MALFNAVIRTREFWIYMSILALMAAIALAGIWLAAGFDTLTRGQLKMGLSCRTGEAQFATIIIGGIVFALACLFTLGEVVDWVERKRMSRAPGRMPFKGSAGRPALHVLGTVVLGLAGFALMRLWCS